MSTAPLPLKHRLERLIQPALIAACLLGAWGSIVVYRAWASNRDHLLAVLDGAGVEAGSVLERVRREPVAHHAQLAAARALVFQLLASPRVETLPAGEQQAARSTRLERLATAHELARDALDQQPNNWEASMLQGATTYLSWSLARDRRLFTESAAWQEPLIKAWREASSQPEPRRILSTAYLELWPALSPDKRRFATDLLASTFADDPKAFQQLGPAWLSTAEDLDTALTIVPNTPHGWEIAARYFAERKRWQRYIETHAKGLDSLEAHLGELIDEGILRLEMRDEFHSRTRFARAVALAPPDQRFVPLVDRALIAYPAGLQTAGTGYALSDWLLWSLELAETGVPSLAPPVVSRLAGVVPDVLPPDAATAALIGGDLSLAERLEKLERDHSTAAWAGYLTTKAHALIERGDLEGAAATLDRVGLAHRSSARFWLARQHIAHLREDDVASDEAARKLDMLRTEAWPASAWVKAKTGRPRHDRLEILPAPGTAGLVFRVDSAPPEGSVVRVRIDGRSVTVRAVRTGDAVVVDAPLEARPHHVEWSTLAGAPAVPGEVRLLDGNDAEGQPDAG